jgi:hypothetical protein
LRRLVVSTYSRAIITVHDRALRRSPQAQFCLQGGHTRPIFQLWTQPQLLEADDEEAQANNAGPDQDLEQVQM